MSVKIRRVSMATFLATGADVIAFPSAAEALAAAEAARATDPAARLAVHTGLAGAGAARARRLFDVANPGQTLVSEVAATAAPEVALHDLGVHRLRDLSPPQRVFALGETTPPRSLDATPNNLPSRQTSFVGREAELAELQLLVAGTRLLTIAGPGGGGKTRLMGRLAAEQAARWPDGAWWVELGTLADPRQVAGAVATAAGVLVDPARGVADSLRAQLARRRLVLCLDNCEHVLDAVAEVAACLQACPEVTILATSREPLGLAGETVWRLSPLPPDEARALFLERAGRVEPDEEAIVSMCSRLDGSPLALELAAAWARTLTPRQIEAGLDDRFALLVRSPRDAVPRHASLLASMTWSHELLDAGDRAVFRRLAVFAGGFDLEAARAVCGEGDVVGALARLVDKSLVVVEDERYRLPETIRQYAEDRLRAADERAVTADRHLDYRLAWVRGLAPELERDKDRWRVTLAREHDNLRAAIEHGLEAEDPTRARELAAELPWLWHLLRQGGEGMDILRRAIARAPDERSVLQARLLVGMALVADTAGPLDVELDAASRAAELAVEHGDDSLLALCLALAAVGRFYTDFDGARETALEAERLAERAGEGFVVHAARALRGILLHLRDEHVPAVELLRRRRRGAGGAGRARGRLDRARVLVGERAADRRSRGGARAGRALGGHRGAARGPPADRDGAQRAGARAGHGGRRGGRARGARSGPAAGGRSGRGTVPARGGPRARPAAPVGGRRRGGGAVAVGRGGLDRRRPADLPRRPGDAAARGGAAFHRACGGGLCRDRARGRAGAGAGHARRAGGRAGRAGVAGGRAGPPPRGAGDPGRPRAPARRRGEPGGDRRPRHGVRRARRPAAGGGGHGTGRDRTPRAAAEPPERLQGLDDAWAAGAALSLDEAAAYARRARGSRRRPEHGWESLTTAEREVVQLAVEGLTNPEIGARLFMSRSTVKTHLSHVYGKLGVANRTELAALAGAERGS